MYKENQMESIYLLSLEHEEAVFGFINSTDRLTLPFATKEKCEEWLIRNGFVFGQCDEFKHNNCTAYWFHQKDTAENYVVVGIKSVDINHENEENVQDWIKKLAYR